MISSSLLLEKTSTPSIELETINVNECFFNKGLEFALFMNEQFNNANMILYNNLAVYESTGEYEIVTESFSDFVSTVKKIIDKFLEFIKSIFKRFVAQLNKIVGSEKYIIKHQDEFKKFGINHQFDMSIFTYTIEDDKPSLKAYDDYKTDIDSLYTDYNRNMEELKQGTVDNTKDYTNLALKKIYQNTIDMHNEDWYDSFRGKVIGKGYGVSKSEYANELFELFRNGESSKENHKIDRTIVDNSLREFKDYTKTVNRIEKNRKTLEREYNNIKKNISDIKDNKIVSADNSIELKTSDARTTAEMFYKAKANQIESMCNIHVLAFTAKLDAVKEQYKQNKDILYRALKKVYKGGDEK